MSLQYFVNKLVIIQVTTRIEYTVSQKNVTLFTVHNTELQCMSTSAYVVSHTQKWPLKIELIDIKNPSNL